MSKTDDINQIILDANERSFQIAFETAVRTGTSLVVNRKGKIVEIKPKYKYVLVPIRSKRRPKKIS